MAASEVDNKARVEKVLKRAVQSFDFTKLLIGQTEIGAGSFSTVLFSKYRDEYVAVKKQSRKQELPDKYLVQELSVLCEIKSFNHPNMINYYGAHDQRTEVADDNHHLYIIFEYCQNGDLVNLISNGCQSPPGWRFRLSLAHQAASALTCLHKHNILHRDIKSSNFLLTHDWTLKLADFGASRWVADIMMKTTAKIPAVHQKQALTFCGTDAYAAPEILFQELYNASIDIFSLGMVFYELMKWTVVGTSGFLERKANDGFDINIDEINEQLPEDKPIGFMFLAQQCLEREADQRPVAQEVLETIQDSIQSLPDDQIPLPRVKPLPPFII